jgi:hypothetical protein
LGAKVLIDGGHTASPEIVALADCRRAQKMQIRGIHIRVAKHALCRQLGKRSREAGLTGAAFSTDDNKFLHRDAFPPSTTDRIL